MHAETMAMFRGVVVIRDIGTAFPCQIGTQQVWAPLTEIHYGSEVAQVGDRGKLVTSRWFAHHIGLGPMPVT